MDEKKFIRRSGQQGAEHQENRTSERQTREEGRDTNDEH
jgi:hypothetical protein